MSYTSLRPPEPEAFDESDENSIQGSPLLDTGSQFDPRQHESVVDGPVSGAYTYVEPYDNSANYRGAEPSWRPTEEFASGVRGSGPPTGPYEGPPATRSTVRPTGPIGAASEAPTGPVSGPYEGTYENPYENPYERHSGESHVGSTSSLDNSQAKPRPRPVSTFDPHAPATAPQSISQVKNSRLSLPTKLAYPEEHESRSSVPSPHSTLQFGTRQARPYSALLRDSFAPGNQSSIGADDDDDDDALPFETTTKQSAQNRPLSAIHLSQMSTGMVMSKDKFENYRKSLSSLDLLKRNGSVISHIDSSQKRDGDDEYDANNDDVPEEDVEDEFLSSEKERKRKLAKERQKQEARMSVYRQRMTKIIGGTSPSLHAPESRSMSAIYPGAPAADGEVDANDDDDDDEDDLMDNIPLGILQAHGFPRNRRKSMGGTSVSSPTMKPLAGSNTAPTSPQTPVTSESRPQSMVSSRMLSRPTSLPPKPAPMANVFEDKETFVSRGLVAEIAREEDMRRRRNTLAVHSAHGVTVAHEPPRVGTPSSSNRQGPVSNGDSNLRELNSKIDALFELLKDRGPEFSRPGSIMGAVPAQGPLGEHIANIRAVPRPESLNSYVTTPYAPSIPETAFHSSSQIVPATPGTPGTPGLRASYAFQQPGHPHMPPPPHMGSHMMPPPPMGPVPNGMHAGYPPIAQSVPVGPELRVNNRPSRMRLVAPEDDDEDDEVEMQKLLHKRQALRAQWREQATTST